MTVELLLTPSILAAFNHLVGQINDLKSGDPAAPATIIVPSQNAQNQLSQRMGSTLNIRINPFHVLSRAILERSGRSLRKANKLTQERLISRLLTEMAANNELSTFEPVYEKAGFREALLEWLREMKFQGISPADIEKQWRTVGRERDRQLALLYRRYQEFLEKRQLTDDAGYLIAAAEALEAAPSLDLRNKSFFVVGFDHFNPLQLRLLHQLASEERQLSIYLLWDRALPSDGLALGRLANTRRGLEHDLSPTVNFLEDDQAEPRLLNVLAANLFSPIRSDLSQRFEDEQSEVVRAIAAPSREGEVRHALSAVKRLLLSGVDPREVAVLAPQPDVYGPLIWTVSTEYGIFVDEQADLDRNPAVAALINLLELAPTFPWRQTFDALRSPYLKQPHLSDEQIDRLEDLTRNRPVIQGRGQWAFALKAQEIQEDKPAKTTFRKIPLVDQFPAEEIDSLKNNLWAFFDQLSPKERRSYAEHTAWLQEIVLGIGPEPAGNELEAADLGYTFQMAACCQDESSNQADQEALAEVLVILGQLIGAAEMVPEGIGIKVPFDTFRRALVEAVRDAKAPRDPGTTAVHFSSLDSARSLSVDHLFVLGLAEGEFPRRPPANPFYAPSERVQSSLPLRKDDPAEDACLWWQSISNCVHSLTLLRPRLDENGVPWLPSPYWNAVVDQLAPGIERAIPLERLPRVDEAASRAELLLALANSDVAVVPGDMQKSWSTVRLAQKVMGERVSWNQAGIFEGVFVSRDLIGELSENYGPEHVWSPSRLNRYGSCPYGFYVENILALSAKTEPEEGFDALQRGSLIHSILESLYKRLSTENRPEEERDQENVLEILESVCDREFSAAPPKYDFRPGPLWLYEQNELRRLLRAFVRWDLEKNQQSFVPRYLERFFGFSSSRQGPFVINDAGGLALKVHGVIDRVDVNNDSEAIVIDYKSGAGTFSKNDIDKGLAFQSPLYALAVENMFKDIAAVAESKYLHVPTRAQSGVLKFSGPVIENINVQAAVNQAGVIVSNIRQGYFPSAPGKPAAGSGLCWKNCQLAALCRVTRVSISKARRM